MERDVTGDRNKSDPGETDGASDRPGRAMSHDAYFRALVSNPRRAAELLHEYLPASVGSVAI